MRSRQSSPGCDTPFAVFGKDENVIVVAAHRQPLGELVTVEESAERLCGQVSRLRFIDWIAARRVSIADYSEVMLGFDWIAAIVSPVVPDRDGGSIRGIRQRFSCEPRRLFGLGILAPS